MKTIKIISLYSLCLVFMASNLNLQAMKQDIDRTNTLTNDTTNNATQPVAKKKKNRKRKKKAVQVALNQHQAAESTPVAQKINNEALKATIKTLNLPQVLQFSEAAKDEYIRKLGDLANMLLMQESIVKKLKEMLPFSTTMIETIPSEQICCFSIDNDSTECSNCVCKKDQSKEKKDTPCITKKIITPEAKAVVLQLHCPLIEKGIWKDTTRLNRYYGYSDSLINHNNEEIAFIARFTKNSIASSWLEQRINSFVCSNLGYSLENMHIQIPSTKKYQDEECIGCHIVYNHANDEINEWLKHKNIHEVVNQIVPHFLFLYEHSIQIAKLFKNFINKDINLSFTSDEVLTIHDLIKHTIEKYEQAQEIYQILYHQLVSEQDHVIRTYPILKRPDIKNAFSVIYLDSSRLERSLPENIHEDEKQSNIQNNDFIADLLQHQKQSKQQKTKKKQPKSRTRPHRKSEIEKKHEQEVIPKKTAKAVVLIQQATKKETFTLPNYAQRILQWFDEAFLGEKQPNFQSIIYHTFNPLADFFIKKFGIPQMRQNQTYSQKQDTVYYMGGEIKHNDGTIETVLFVNTYDNHGVCYHRGFERHKNELLDEFATNKFSFDFPTLSEEPTYTKKYLPLDNAYSIYGENTYDENEFCINIRDSRNDISITLFKPLERQKR